MQINMLVLHRFPETFHKHIIPPGALAIHADSNIVVFQELSEGKAGELAALIGIHDLGLAVFIDRFLERIQTKLVSMVIEIRCDKTRLEYQSMTTVRYTNPRLIGMYVISIAHTWFDRVIGKPLSK